MRRTGLGRDTGGTAVVEFAIALPVLVMLLLGSVFWGQYFLVAHSVQQVANDAARATVAGLSPAERDALARSDVAALLASMPELGAARLRADVSEASPWVTVRVRYDAGYLPLMSNGLVPAPPAVIERRATVRQGGYS